ncbi:hypothetical protein D3C87_1953860 [compost metagenome]
MPIKKPIRLASTATLAEREKRVQLVAWVAPLTKVPNTSVMAVDQSRVAVGTTASKPSSPPTLVVATHIDSISNTIMAGTAMYDRISSPR